MGLWGGRELTQGCSEGLRSNLGLEDEIPLGFLEAAPNPTRIPKGFRPPARGCEERATPGMRDRSYQPQRGCGQVLGKLGTQPRWGCREARWQTQGCPEGVRGNLGLQGEIPLGFSEAAPNPKGFSTLQLPWNSKGILPSMCLESQRDSALQPGVARNELPRECVTGLINPNGVAAWFWVSRGRNPDGVVGRLDGRPKVAPKSFGATLGWRAKSRWDFQKLR